MLFCADMLMFLGPQTKNRPEGGFLTNFRKLCIDKRGTLFLKKVIKMSKRKDCHVHFRDGEEALKQTIRGGSEQAAAQGIIAVGDMPNTKPPILWKEDVILRLRLAEKEKPLVKYFLWIGLTSYEEQIKEAIRVEREITQVIGLKLYAGQSTGELGVTDANDQKKIYEILSGMDYQGVLAVHCEKEKKLKPKLWNPEKPWTHGDARPILAETEAVKDQIRFAKAVDFKGNLHICHASCKETIKIVSEARKAGLRVSCEITPHHILLTDVRMRGRDGLRFKVNPPLRGKETVEGLREIFLILSRKDAEYIFISTDYAPHTLGEKLNPRIAPSGIADYSLYSKLLTWLKERGLSDLQIDRLTFDNITKTFGGKF